ncbi:hypothetical protein ACQ4PT_069876 [Festuca glaucescens]
MAAADGETVALRTEVAALRLRVLELERENQRLAQIASSCSCSAKVRQEALSCFIHLHRAYRDERFGFVRRIRLRPLQLPVQVCMAVIKNYTRGNSMKVELQSMCNSDGGGHSDAPKIKRSHAKRTGHQVGTVSHCQKRLVALKIMYFGQRFYGFASEAQTEPTIESEVFKALERARLLVSSRKESCYSRCGRTDKGVSATGQVISLYLRSNMRDAGGNVLDERSEIDYVRVLNKILPRDIRVIGWCPVAADFLARFSCLGREYKYLFWKGGLDTSKMQKAASKFIGEHDFRNFCKMDAVNVQR